MQYEGIFLINCLKKWNKCTSYGYENLEKIDWEKLWELCEFHKVVGFVFYNMLINCVNIPEEIKERANNWFEKTKKINELQRAEFCSLAEQMKENIFAIKGIWLTNCLYKTDLVRRGMDIDIVFNKKEKKELEDYLCERGYVQGIFDYIEKRIVLATREEILYQELYTHELYQYIKLIDNVPIRLDCNFKFSWCGEKSYLAPNPDWKYLCQNSTQYTIGETIISSFSKELQFVHLCVHCYNEYHYFLYESKVEYRELRLYRLIDIRTIVFDCCMNWAEIKKIGDEVGAMEQIYFCLSLNKSIFGDDLFSDYICSENSETINRYITRDGEYTNWRISLEDRLFDIEARKKETEWIYEQNGKRKRDETVKNFV